MSSKSERIRQNIIYIFLYRSAYRIVKITLRIYIFCSHCLMNKSVQNTLYTDYELYPACRAEQMTDHRLCRVDGNIFCRVAEREFDGFRLKQVIMVCACSVSIDIVDLLRRRARLLRPGNLFFRPGEARTPGR